MTAEQVESEPVPAVAVNDDDAVEALGQGGRGFIRDRQHRFPGTEACGEGALRRNRGRSGPRGRPGGRAPRVGDVGTVASRVRQPGPRWPSLALAGPAWPSLALAGPRDRNSAARQHLW